MPLIDTNHQRAALLVLLLGVALVIALTPYATGLIGIPVLYAVFAPVHEWLSLRVRPKLAATVVVALALFLIVVPGVSFAGLIVSQAQEIAAGVIRNPLLGRLRELQPGASTWDLGSPTWGPRSCHGSVRPPSGWWAPRRDWRSTSPSRCSDCSTCCSNRVRR